MDLGRQHGPKLQNLEVDFEVVLFMFASSPPFVHGVATRVVDGSFKSVKPFVVVSKHQKEDDTSMNSVLGGGFFLNDSIMT